MTTVTKNDDVIKVFNIECRISPHSRRENGDTFNWSGHELHGNGRDNMSVTICHNNYNDQWKLDVYINGRWYPGENWHKDFEVAVNEVNQKMLHRTEEIDKERSALLKFINRFF